MSLYELVQSQSWEHLEPPRVQISSNRAVNSLFVFSESFGIFVLSSLPKHSNNNTYIFFTTET